MQTWTALPFGYKWKNEWIKKENIMKGWGMEKRDINQIGLLKFPVMHLKSVYFYLVDLEIDNN